MSELTIDTPRGLARAYVSHPEHARAQAALVLGHGAGGGVGAADLRTARSAALAVRCAVALVEQPYRVAGRRSAAPAAHLDEAWTAVVAQLREGDLTGLPIVTGGRSSGARVACRTVAATGAIGVVCLAFPLEPPRRANAKPTSSRLAELDVAVPVLVVQGRSDRFGMPPPAPSRTVVPVTGDHGLKSDLAAVDDAVSRWLSDLLPARAVP
ncbi:MAG: alpha/beta family hydrolase [Solirubrobacteraceae bacterium]